MTTQVSDNGVTLGSPNLHALAYQHFNVGASVAANALNVNLNPCTISFRSTTLGSGAPAIVEAASTLSLVVPSGATLGTVNAVQSDIYLLAINNAGTMELAVVNVSGGVNLDETGLISTTAISASANSATVIYSTTARTNVAYRVIGLVRSTQTTAGTWATQPSLVQPVGGQAFTSMSSLGYGQTPQTVTRTAGVTYYNTTGKPIVWEIQLAASGNLTPTIAGLARAVLTTPAGCTITASYVVAPNVAYSYVQGAGTSTHVEMR